MAKMFAYIRDSADEEFKSRFTVIFGSSGYHEYFFKLFSIIEDDIPDLKPEGYEEYKKVTSAETTDLADRQVKWIQAVVPMFLKDRLREKFDENFFEVVVPKEMQKACQIKRIEDDADDKLPVDEYLDWIQYSKLASMKEIRDEVKEVLSIPLPEDGSGKHFYSSWFEAVNRIRRIPAHPSGRAYKAKDIEVLAVVVDHLKSNLPEHYVDGKIDAPFS
jgi:DNA sulfur modification protein DndB